MNEGTITSGNLIVTFQTGVDEHNEAITFSKTYRDLNASASRQALIATANAIATLVGYPVAKVERVVKETL